MPSYPPMNERQRGLNEELQALADGYRLGRIGLDEYRRRRRALLTISSHAEPDQDRTAVTQPNLATQQLQSPAAFAARPRGGAAALEWIKQLALPVAFVLLLLVLLMLWI